mmetsp:Transcript_114387/g.324011  ORF Transcript_114387/g.324011 Transcript_114387/m.324011 type:complete len:237 (-) Transcript_114387:146-856(-)
MSAWACGGPSRGTSCTTTHSSGSRGCRAQCTPCRTMPPSARAAWHSSRGWATGLGSGARARTRWPSARTCASPCSRRGGGSTCRALPGLPSHRCRHSSLRPLRTRCPAPWASPSSSGPHPAISSRCSSSSAAISSKQRRASFGPRHPRTTGSTRGSSACAGRSIPAQAWRLSRLAPRGAAQRTASWLGASRSSHPRRAATRSSPCCHSARSSWPSSSTPTAARARRSLGWCPSLSS